MIPSYNIDPGETPSGARTRRELAQALYLRATKPREIKHWTQGLAQLAESYFAGRELGRLDDQEREAMKLAQEAPGLNPAPPQSAGATFAQGGQTAVNENPSYVQAIAGIESGGKYDALGPVIEKTGDRAYGKYQVMGANVPAWTKAHLGQEMTPDQFLASPEAQDAVFKGQFGQYAQKYGPEGASKAWFAGEKGMHNPNARDQLGTTVAQYGQKFTQATGGQPQAPGAPNIPPEQAAYIRKLLGNPYTHAKGLALYQQYAKPSEYGFQTTPDGTILRTDPKRGSVDPVYRAEAKPTFSEIGTDPQTGQPVRGFVDPVRRQVTPYALPGAPVGESKVPPVPPGVDPKEWRAAHSKRVTEEAMPASGETVSKLRNEVQGLPSYKNLAQAAPVYRSMLDAAARDNRAADVNLIYGMAKIMDPGSVVRESEMTVAQAVATLPQQLRATVESQLTSAGRLSPEVRAAIMQEAHSRVASYQTMFDQDAGMYRGIAQRGRMNEADVLPSFGPFEQFKAPALKPTGKTKSGLSWSVE